jgi:hypothetical protein
MSVAEIADRRLRYSTKPKASDCKPPGSDLAFSQINSTALML